ncbi:MAG: hypothetical protein SGPRY_008967 [Prymnesium sp.]
MAVRQPLLAREPTRVLSGSFLLGNTILGAGMLSLPSAFAATGWLLATPLLLLFAAASTCALAMLSECADQVGRPSSFHAVANTAMPGFAALFDAAIAIKCFGVATSYLVVVGDSMPKAMVALGLGGALLERRLWVGASLAIAAPLAYRGRISALRHISLAAVGFVLLIVIMALLYALQPFYPFSQPCEAEAELSECRGSTQLLTSTGQTLRALPLFVFPFTCHQNMISITNELARPTRARCWAVAALSIGAAMVLYLVLSSSGYATFGDKSDILSNYPSDSVVVALARVMISFKVHPTRACITSMIEASSIGKTLSASSMHLFLTTLFVLITATIAFLLSDLGLVLSVSHTS